MDGKEDFAPRGLPQAQSQSTINNRAIRCIGVSNEASISFLQPRAWP